MVSINRNIADGEHFPSEPSSSGALRRTEFSFVGSQRSDDWLADVTVAWHELLATVGDLQLSTTTHIRRSRKVLCNQSDMPKVVLSILNGFQLAIWMFESRAENLGNKEKFDAPLTRIQESIQRDILRLRKLVSESSFQSRLTLRTVELVERLEAFSRRLMESVKSCHRGDTGGTSSENNN